MAARYRHKDSVMVDELSRLYDADERRFRDNYAADIYNATEDQLAAKLVFSAHSLEKSLSNDNFEPGHGFHAAYLLTEMVNVYLKKGYDKDHLAYISTLSTLKVFYGLHKDTQHIDKVNTILGDIVPIVEACDSPIGGAASISGDSKKDNSQKNFQELAEGRYAVRSYSDQPVSKKDIEEVVQIATKTPTVCNRQAIHVYAMYEKDVIEAVLEVQGGITHYDTPPVLLLVTADNAGYVGPNERNQGFVDGGLFAMSLLYALEYKGLAGCPLHAMLDEKGDHAVRGMLAIAEGEKFITFMSVGHFKDSNNICKSFRYPVGHFLSEKNILHEYEPLAILPEQERVMEKPSIIDELRIKLRIRTRLKKALKDLKHTTRVRTRVREFLNNIQYKNADGAIITLAGYYNYGNMVQRFALQEFLRQQGYKFVSYAKDKPLEGDDVERLKYTYDFVERNIWRKQYDERDRFKTYIVGSDQVWRKWGYDDIFDELGYYFFDFAKDRHVRRIAYAASIGQDSLKAADYTEEFIPYARELVQKFNSVAMRESSGVEIVRNEWGVDAALVVDPTLLLKAEDYNKLIDSAPYDIKRITSMFTYFILTDEPKRALIAKIAKDAGLKDQGIYLESKDTLRPVEEWLAGIRDAQLVVIDSFHGMVFSIIYHTPFIVLESGTGGASRMTSLLEKLGLQDRYITSDKAETFKITDLPPIQWHEVDKKLDKLRKASSDWLLRAVQSDSKN